MLHVLKDAVSEPALAEEWSTCADEDRGDMANLREDRTGVPGVIVISTRIGGHGPRVKWFRARPAAAAPSFSVSIADAPQLLASSVDPRLARERFEAVSNWVRLNRDVLLEFWNAGADLFEDERDAMLARLRRLA